MKITSENKNSTALLTSITASTPYKNDIGKRIPCAPLVAGPLVTSSSSQFLILQKYNRTELLSTYKKEKDRPILVTHARDAAKLRNFSEVMYRKNFFSRLTHKIPVLRPSKNNIDELKAMNVDVLIGKIKNGTLCSNRTTLTDVATHHLRKALNFDQALFAQGVKKMAKWEGVHSSAGRGITFGAAIFGFSIFPVVHRVGTAATDVLAKIIKICGHHLPTAIVNPLVTGNMRVYTDIRKSCDNGGISKLTKNIEQARQLSRITKNINDKKRALKEILLDSGNEKNFLKKCADGSVVLTEKYRSALCDHFLAAYAAQKEYKDRITLAKSQTWSKGYGMGVNALATSVQAAGLAFPVAIPASLAVQALCIPLQWAAGYLDLHTAQAYNFRANIKCGEFLTEEGKLVSPEKLTEKHIDETRLRSMFQPFEAQKIELIREIYTDELGEIHFALDNLTDILEKSSRLNDAKNIKLKIKTSQALKELKQTLKEKEAHVRLFESLDADSWQRLPVDSTIGKCLDDQAFFVKQGYQARRNKPGEVSAQVWQRYKQTYGDGIFSAGVLVPGIDGIMNTASLSGPDAQPGTSLAVDITEAVAVTTAATTFAAGTGIVRIEKADDKKELAKPIITADSEKAKHDALKARWAISMGSQKTPIDLSHTGAFDRKLHSRTQRVWRFIKIIPRGFFSSEKSLYHTMLARQARSATRKTLQQALDILQLEQVPARKTGSEPKTMAALKSAFHALPEVSKYFAQR